MAAAIFAAMLIFAVLPEILAMQALDQKSQSNPLNPFAKTNQIRRNTQGWQNSARQIFTSGNTGSQSKAA